MEVLFTYLFRFILNVIEKLGYGGIFMLSLFESANIPIPSEIIVPFSGFLVSIGSMNFWAVVIFASLGNLTGSIISYELALRYGRRPVLFFGKFIWTSEEHLKLAERFFDKYGVYSIFFGRLLPVIRTFISFPAGMFQVTRIKFIVYTFIGAFIWSFFLTYIGFELGQNWTNIRAYFHVFEIAIITILFIVFGFWIIMRVRSK